MNLEKLLNTKSFIKKASGIIILGLALGLGNGCKKDGSLPRGKILYSSLSRSSVLGNYELFSMNSDGSNKTRLTNNSWADVCASFSPDGSKIAFASNENKSFDIYTMRIDGTNKNKLTKSNDTDKSCPVWSRDGKKLAFIVSKMIEPADIYTMDSDGSNPENITRSPQEDDRYPSWFSNY